MTPVHRGRNLAPLPAHLFHVLHLIPPDGEWVDDEDLTVAAVDRYHVPLTPEGRIVKLRHLCRAGFVVMDRSGARPMWTRTPKGTDVLAARIRKQVRS